MEIRGIKIKKKKFIPRENGFFILKPPEYFTVPLLADDGDKPIRAVNVGELVKEGSMIAKPSGRYGSFVYSPCSGKVISVIKKLNVSGNECEHVVIARDMQEEKSFFDVIEEGERTQERLLKRLYESGMIDNFKPYDPAYKKYLLKCKVKKLVINCTEDDPYKTSESALIDAYTSEIVEGAKLLQIVSKAEKIVFIFTSKQKNIAKLVHNQVKKLKESKNIRIRIYPNMYPLHNTRLIGYYETGKMVPEGTRTAETNVIVDNPSNCYDFYNAVVKGQPATQKAVTVSGNNCLRKANYFIKNGTSIKHILDVVGTKTRFEDNMLIYGGIMSGVAQETLEISAALTASSILFCDIEEYSQDKESVCINCGKCVDHCPVRLHVKNIDEAIIQRNYTKAKALGVEACIGCGVCSYICPAKRYLSQRMNYMKDMAQGKRAKNPESSEYILVEGEDLKNKSIDEFDKILQAHENFELPGDNGKETPAIEEMLLSLNQHPSKLFEVRINKPSHSDENAGGDNNE